MRETWWGRGGFWLNGRRQHARLALFTPQLFTAPRDARHDALLVRVTPPFARRFARSDPEQRRQKRSCAKTRRSAGGGCELHGSCGELDLRGFRAATANGIDAPKPNAPPICATSSGFSCFWAKRGEKTTFKLRPMAIASVAHHLSATWVVAQLVRQKCDSCPRG